MQMNADSAQQSSKAKVHHGRVLESPVNRDPSRLPRFENALTEAFDMPIWIPVLEKLAGENIPRARDPCLAYL
jgi:hypothetical protein